MTDNVNPKSDKKIRRTLVEEGLIFPETESEILQVLQSMNKLDIQVPDALKSPIFLFNRKSNLSFLSKYSNTDIQPNQEIAQYMAMAAREGKEVIPNEILEQMQKDREQTENNGK